MRLFSPLPLGKRGRGRGVKLTAARPLTPNPLPQGERGENAGAAVRASTGEVLAKSAGDEIRIQQSGRPQFRVTEIRTRRC